MDIFSEHRSREKEAQREGNPPSEWVALRGGDVSLNKRHA